MTPVEAPTAPPAEPPSQPSSGEPQVGRAPPTPQDVAPEKIERALNIWEQGIKNVLTVLAERYQGAGGEADIKPPVLLVVKGKHYRAFFYAKKPGGRFMRWISSPKPSLELNAIYDENLIRTGKRPIVDMIVNDDAGREAAAAAADFLEKSTPRFFKTSVREMRAAA